MLESMLLSCRRNQVISDMDCIDNFLVSVQGLTAEVAAPLLQHDRHHDVAVDTAGEGGQIENGQLADRLSTPSIV